MTEEIVQSFVTALQTNLPAWVIGWFVPLPILLFFGVLLRPWLRRVGSVVFYMGTIYVLSIGTGIFLSLTQEISDVEGATVAGLYAPIVYGTVSALIVAIVQFVGRVVGLGAAARPLRSFKTILRLIVGGSLGTVAGLLLGSLIGFTVLTGFAVYLMPSLLVYMVDIDTIFTDLVLDQIIGFFTYLCGGLGFLFGVGWGIHASTPFRDDNYDGWLLREFQPADQQQTQHLLQDEGNRHFAYVDDLLDRDLDNIEAYYVGKGETVIVADGGTRLLACGTLVATEKSYEVARITHLALDDEEEREEVARSVVRSLVRLARQRGFRRVIVELPESWDTAVRMYKQMGFTIEQRGFDSTLRGVKLRMLFE